MEPDRWEQIERLYHAALEHQPGARGAFLVRACGGDEEMRREVASLLDHDDGPAIFFEAPILEFAAQLQPEERTAEMFDPLLPLGNGLAISESESPLVRNSLLSKVMQTLSAQWHFRPTAGGWPRQDTTAR
jgi:hypothetical protein